MKKALFFLFIFTIGSLLFAQQRSGQDGFEYEVVDGKSVTITRYNGSATTLEIPAQIQGLPVTAIGERAFLDCESLTSITIPSSVTSIGDVAFAYCRSLTSVTIPSSVTSIGYGAFYICLSLTSITVDNRNPSYASIDGVLFDKNILTLISHPAGRNQGTYVIPYLVMFIGDGAFAECRSLTSVTIPSSVTFIGYFAFSNCESLTSVTIPSSVTFIGDAAFSNCESLTSVTIPSSVTSIGDYAFFDCESLASVTLSRLTRVGEDVFPETARIIYSD